MSEMADTALARLVSSLPLATRQANLPRPLRLLHQAILRSLAERGRALSHAEIQALVPDHSPSVALWTLASLDLVVLKHDGSLAGAYPLTTEPTPHEIGVNGNWLWAMCAMDALAVAPLFDTSVEIGSECPITGAKIRLWMTGEQVLDAKPGPDVQLGIWWRQPYTNAARNFCPGVMFLRDVDAAQAWRDGRADHDFAPLPVAVDVAARFFRPFRVEAPAEAPALA
jgi:hypothetical protein